jgi:hypothetical protein
MRGIASNFNGATKLCPHPPYPCCHFLVGATYDLNSNVGSNKIQISYSILPCVSVVLPCISTSANSI